MPVGKRTVRRPVRVYAIVTGRLPKTVRPSGAGSLRFIRRGRLAAVVSDGSQSIEPTPTNLRRYDRTMRALAGDFPAILPARFGTSVMEDELMLILSSRHTALMRALQAVRGRVQMTIRVIASGDGDEGKEPTEHSVNSGSRGRDYLTGKARVARAVPGFAPIRRAAARWIRDERVEHRPGVSSVYHLIPRSSVHVYRRAVDAAAAAAGVRLVVSGPWPPYAFGGD